VPLWLKFAVRPSAERLDRYLEASDAFPELALTLFSHGVESPGYAPIDRWPTEARLLGVDPVAYPQDFGVFTRFGESLRRLPERYPLPHPLSVEQVAERFGLEQLQPGSV
jgi:hypothetical protein